MLSRTRLLAPRPAGVRSAGLAAVLAAVALFFGPAGIRGASPPTVAVTPNPVSFGSLFPGEMRDVMVTVANPGADEVRVTGLIAPNGFQLVQAPPIPVPAGGNVQVTIRFTAGAPGRIRAGGTFRLEGAGAKKGSGSAVLEAEVHAIRVQEAGFDFGEVELGDTASESFLVTNVSNRAITLFSHTDGEGNEFTVGPKKRVLDPGEEIVLTVKFSPGTTGERTSVLRLSPRRGKKDFPQVSLPLRGVGIRKVSLLPDRLDFGTVARNVFHTRMVTLSNLTDEPQEVTVVGRLDPEYFTVRPAGKMVLAPHANVGIEVQFGARGRCRHRGRLEVLLGGAVRALTAVTVRSQ